MLKCKTIKHILFWRYRSVDLKNNVLNPRHRALRCGRSSPSQRQKRRSSTSLQDSEGQRWHVHAFTHEGVGLCSTSFHMSPCSIDKVGCSTILKKCLLSAFCRIFGKSCMLARFIRIAKVLTWGTHVSRNVRFNSLGLLRAGSLCYQETGWINSHPKMPPTSTNHFPKVRFEFRHTVLG